MSRDRPLPIAGPSGNDEVPAFDVFLSRLFDERQGAFPMLGPTLGGTRPNGRGVRLQPTVIDAGGREESVIVRDEGFRVSAFGIPHGMPALAFRVETGGRTVVFSTDQNGTNERFAAFAHDADVLVMHMAIAPGTSNPIHASPAMVGQMAAAARPKRLVLSHLGAFDMTAALADVRKAYTGPITLAEDLACVRAE